MVDGSVSDSIGHRQGMIWLWNLSVWIVLLIQTILERTICKPYEEFIEHHHHWCPWNHVALMEAAVAMLPSCHPWMKVAKTVTRV